MNKKGILFLVFALAVFFLPLQAQVTFSIPSITVDPASSFSLDIQVSSFDNIAGVQFTLAWDPSVLEFQGVENFGIQLNDINFNAEDALTQGTLRFLWFDPMGISLDDGDTFYSIVFKAIGAPGDATSIAFTSNPTPIEVIDADENELDPVFETGQIELFDPTSTGYVSAPGLINVSPGMPNPFVGGTQINFEIKLAIDARVIIWSPDGKEIFADNRFFNPGEHTLFFPENIFPTAGTYFFQMTAPGLKVTQKLMRM